jgi:hypothetical protein
MYLERLPVARMVRFEDSGHTLWEPGLRLFRADPGGVLGRLDNRCLEGAGWTLQTISVNPPHVAGKTARATIQMDVSTCLVELDLPA